MGFAAQYKQWAISILPSTCNEGWMFYVASPEGDLLSSCQLFTSVDVAMQAAQRHIDRLMMLDEVISILDPLVEAGTIATKDYVRCVEIFRLLATGPHGEVS